ncbi:MFS transporter [Portibacter marinus]|uniref:MFS transporter n=1 Tax=Portibacter marinus TaxID=2898660 RepID=UPI001F46414D|nr:MFS transporter [Portibacter marinus]
MNYRWAVNLFFLVNGFGYASWAARIPALQEKFDLSNSNLGILLLAHSIGAFIAMPLTGFLISKYTSRTVTMISGLIFPLFLLAIPWMTGYYTLLIPFLLMGSTTGMMDVAMNAQAVEVEMLSKKPIMTMFHAMFSIGMVIGGLVGSFAINMDLTMISHFTAVVITSLLVISISSIYLYPDQSEFNHDDPIFVLPKGPLIILGVIAFCCMMGEGAIADWSTIYMKKIVQSQEFLYAMGLTAFAAMMTAGRLVGDRGRSMIGDRLMLLSGGLMSLLGIGLVLITDFPYIVILGFALVGLGLSNIVPIVYSLAGKMKGIKPGVGIAMATTIGYSGFMIGPPLIGFVADATSLYYGMMLLAVLFLVMFLLIQMKKL